MRTESQPPDYLLQLRADLFKEMEEAEVELSRLRLKVEFMESDLRIGRPQPPDYQETKGHLLPQAEARILNLFRDLLKLEDRINGVGACSLGPEGG